MSDDIPDAHPLPPKLAPKHFEFHGALLRRLLDAQWDCELAFETVTRLSVDSGSHDVERLAEQYAEYLIATWQAANQTTHTLLRHTASAFKIPHFTRMMFLHAITEK
jgi:hypothetical protein